MNYEALGRYTHLKKTREKALFTLHTLGLSVSALGKGLGWYMVPAGNEDPLPELIGRVKAVLPEIEAQHATIREATQEMRRLQDEYGIQD